MRHIDIVFDGPPGPEPACLLEIEDANGRSIEIGEWVERPDGRWVLRLTPEDLAQPSQGPTESVN
jgi:hypothetical protein